MVFETFCEPIILQILDKTEYEKKVYVEGTSLFIRGAVLFGLLWFELGLLAFGLAHCIYTLVMLLMYKFQTDEPVPLFSFKLIKLEKSQVYYLDTHITQLTQMSLIGVFRFLLTEGENLVMNFTSNLSMVQKGEYSLISNLLSII